MTVVLMTLIRKESASPHNGHLGQLAARKVSSIGYWVSFQKAPCWGKNNPDGNAPLRM
jgi:hypothetical protein